MTRRDAGGIAIASILFLIIGIAWFGREHKKALDAQCIFNLMCIDGAKKQWALEKYAARFDAAYSNAVPTAEDILAYNSRNQYPMPICPRGGTYTFGRVADWPTCSFPGHALTVDSMKWPAEFGVTDEYPGWDR